MERRCFLKSLSLAAGGVMFGQTALAASNRIPDTVLAAAWYASGALPAPLSGGEGHYVGALKVDWENRDVRMLGAIPVSHRPHGIVATPDLDGFYAVAFRHGSWLLRADAMGREMRRIDLREQEGGKRTFNGHLELSHDGKWLFTTETDVASGQSWVSLRRASTLERVAEFPTNGIDAHQTLLDDEGMLIVANGGIRWTRQDQKLDLDQMDSSLVRINPENGALLGQWRMDDRRLSLRHMAWSVMPNGQRVLGIGMQGQHDDADHRRASSTLALWDGKALSAPSRSPLGLGYIGDIAPGPGGGFLMSAEIHDRAVFWHPGEASKLHLVAEMSRAAALAHSSEENSLFVGGEKGVARWVLNEKSNLLAWPFPIAPDHHWVVLAG